MFGLRSAPRGFGADAPVAQRAGAEA
jgi:hypothetical protein